MIVNELSVMQRQFAIILQCIFILALMSSKLALVVSIISTNLKNPVADQKSLIIAGSHVAQNFTSLCSQVGMNALGWPFVSNNSVPGFNRSVALYVVHFLEKEETNAVWIYNSTTKAIQIQWPSPYKEILCLDNMEQFSFDPKNPFPLHILPCTGELRQQWMLEKTDDIDPSNSGLKIRSAMAGTDNQPVYLRGHRVGLPQYPFHILALYLDSQDDGKSVWTFTFVPVPENGNSLASKVVRMPSRGDSATNLIANGGFESAGQSTPIDFESMEVKVYREWPFVCSWTVAEGTVSIVPTSPWSWPSKEGLNTLKL